MKELIGKLNKIQKNLVCEKNLYNSFGKYKYRNLESIFDAVKGLLDGTIVKIDEDIVIVGDRIYVKAIASITDGQDTISATAFAREADMKKGMDSAQVTISTSSYASILHFEELHL